MRARARVYARVGARGGAEGRVRVTKGQGKGSVYGVPYWRPHTRMRHQTRHPCETPHTRSARVHARPVFTFAAFLPRRGHHPAHPTFSKFLIFVLFPLLSMCLLYAGGGEAWRKRTRGRTVKGNFSLFVWISRNIGFEYSACSLGLLYRSYEYVDLWNEVCQDLNDERLIWSPSSRRTIVLLFATITNHECFALNIFRSIFTLFFFFCNPSLSTHACLSTPFNSVLKISSRFASKWRERFERSRVQKGQKNKEGEIRVAG